VVRNGARHLEEAIQSVLAQDYDCIEYVIVDGGSTDGTLDVIRRHEQDLAWWVSEPDNGVFDAMNKGIRRTSGSLVKLLNADDRLTRDSVRRAVELYTSHDQQPVVISSDIVVIDADGRPLKHMGRTRAANPVRPLLHPSWYVDRRVYDQYGLYTEHYRIGADFEMLLRLHFRGVPFLYTQEPLAEFRTGGQSNRLILSSIVERDQILRKYYPRAFAVRATVPFAYRGLRQTLLVLVLGEERFYRLRARVGPALRLDR